MRLLALTAQSPALCVGLDPHPQVLEAFGFSDTPSGLEGWSQHMVGLLGEAEIDVAKPQVALFERHGVAGMSVLAELMGQLRERGVFVIGDAKRGDIGTTMTAYARAWLSSGGDFEVDALTVSPYLGVGALLPALELARDEQKVVFVLAATSNPEAFALQSAKLGTGQTVAASVIDEVATWCHQAGSPAGIGFVIGATLDQGALGVDLAPHSDMPILAPGYGAQGATLSDVGRHFPHSRHVVPVVARSVLAGGPSRFVESCAIARRELTTP